MYSQRILLLIFFTSFSLQLLSQDNTVFRSINGVLYKVHTVTAGETVFQLSKTHGMSPEEIEKYNPSVKEGLKIGQEILIPTIKSDEKLSQEKRTNHTVEVGETLFSISRKYNVDPGDIKKWNNLNSNVISIGQILSINAIEENTASSITNNEINSPENDIYIVQKGETLYALSRKFNVSVDDLAQWNELDDLSLKEGQKLIINGHKVPKKQTADTLFTVKENQSESKKETEWKLVKKDTMSSAKSNTLTIDSTKEKPKQLKKPPEELKIDPEVINNTSSNTEIDEFVEVVERGVAELIPNTADVRKYLALHRTAKVGTIIRVRNEMNGREIWARVINKLPDTGDNKNVLVKISRAAYDQLGALDKKFRVVVTYIP